MGTPIRPELIRLTGRIQDGIQAAIIDNPTGPRMAMEPVKEPLRARPGLAAMPAKMPDKPQGTAEGQRVMLAFKPPAATDAPPTAKPTGEMKMRSGEQIEQQGAGYLRLRIRVTDSSMRIVAAQRVDGPLSLPDSFVGEHAYEVTLDGKLVAREGIPDIGVSRSFPRPGTLEHFVTERPTTEITMRVPLDRVPETALARLRLSLFRLPDALPRTVTGTLAEQLGQQARVVARIETLSQARIEPAAFEVLRKLAPKVFETPPR
jgi:hypothetical protein